VSDEQGRRGVIEQESETARWEMRVEREVSGAGVEHGKQGDDHLGGPWEADGDERFRADGARREEASQQRAGGEEAGVGDGEEVAAEGDGVSREGGLLLDEGVDEVRAVEVIGGAVKVEQEAA
jgi:hypothetical protein